MAEHTGIEWAKGPHELGATWNPWRGCRKISPACAKCYMFRDEKRYGRDPSIVVRSKTTFRDPMKWKEPHGIFTCSLSDFFIEEADQWRDDACQIIDSTPRHTYLVLTKRIERLEGLQLKYAWKDNVWLGASVENSRFYDRIDHLARQNAVVRFLSIEPLLGPMPDLPLDGIHWVLIGGESGPGFRPFNMAWAFKIIEQCQKAGVAVFVKQTGGWPDKGTNPEKWPSDLNVRQFPVTAKKPVSSALLSFTD